MKQGFKYSKALKEIEEIISEIESETIDVDVLTEKVKRAITLIKSCKERLRDTEEELKDVLKDFGEDKHAVPSTTVGATGGSGLFD
ncbi:exodeoxyribonuclease VII small subunit [Candidatus Magnetominusculus xianensis]|uniref:Exodeoxyribonuclease VII small subunit n=1 Tax=Candidatus Magnetominusculus xianensis TaxID=1748249 RepID=A0ABR5SH21_9BACT|nr:exodeoxyribonuclease VII small subunit [Candidatus Magnetominusculus xianensis]KWT86076.1 exodeoxyribonuclease VII small subunit [Candidatus Magnetominusculus xianensis]MBF0404405.1 exodeoxyribonuclease VII small subunit [Nitrospirota bacterium]